MNISRSNGLMLQKAWQYATLVIEKPFKFPDGSTSIGLRGRLIAYEELLRRMRVMANDKATKELFLPLSKFQEPVFYRDMVRYARNFRVAIELEAKAQGIDPKGGGDLITDDNLT